MGGRRSNSMTSIACEIENLKEAKSLKKRHKFIKRYHVLILVVLSFLTWKCLVCLLGTEILNHVAISWIRQGEFEVQPLYVQVWNANQMFFFIMGAGGAKFLYSAPCYVTKTVKAKTQWNDVSETGSPTLKWSPNRARNGTGPHFSSHRPRNDPQLIKRNGMIS